jgi:hypothetical protein
MENSLVTSNLEACCEESVVMQVRAQRRLRAARVACGSPDYAAGGRKAHR